MGATQQKFNRCSAAGNIKNETLNPCRCSVHSIAIIFSPGYTRRFHSEAIGTFGECSTCSHLSIHTKEKASIKKLMKANNVLRKSKGLCHAQWAALKR
jgi:hypothetical protein